MIGLHLSKQSTDTLQILCLGAHSDDIEIGCGGTLLHLKQLFPRLKFHWIVFSAAGPRAQEAAKAAELFTAGCEKEIVLKEFRDGFLPYNGAQVKEFFEETKSRVQPDLIFTQWGGDSHQDHRLLSELTLNTFRNHMILEYEIPKYDGDLGSPNFFVRLSDEVCRKKIQHILNAFSSQAQKHWFTEDLFRGLMRIRGIEAGGQARHAEGFYCRKLVI